MILLYPLGIRQENILIWQWYVRVLMVVFMVWHQAIMPLILRKNGLLCLKQTRMVI